MLRWRMFWRGLAVCDDGNPCTNDACDPNQGCLSIPPDANCDDGDACTFGTTCGAEERAQEGPSLIVRMAMHAPLIPVILRWDVFEDANFFVCDDGDDCTVKICNEGFANPGRSPCASA